ncbi:hypothetical protein ACSXEK_15990 (plasmid) [Clostridium perfringens]
MKDVILLKDIISILPQSINLYYKYSYIGEFNKSELIEGSWWNDKVVLISGEDDSNSVYLTDKNRSF